MLIVVAQNAELGSQVLATLQSWSDEGLLHEFLWCGDVEGELRFSLIRRGERIEGNLEFLVAGVSGDVNILNVVGPTEPSLSPNALLEKIKGRMTLLTDNKQVRPVVSLVVPETVNQDVSWVEHLEGRVVLWAAEDRSDPALWSTPFPHSLPSRASHAVVTVGRLWVTCKEGEDVEGLLEVDGSVGELFLARAYTRLVVFPELRDVIVGALELEDGNVPRPTGTYDRVDFDAVLPKLAHVFVGGQAALTPQDLSKHLLVDPPKQKLTLGGVLALVGHFIESAPKRLRAEAVEALRANVYNAVAKKFEQLPGIEMKRWEDFDEKAPIGLPAEELNFSAFIEDGANGELWTNLWATSFSLIDGSPLTLEGWEEALPAHDRDHYPVVLSRYTVVGRPDVPVSESGDFAPEAPTPGDSDAVAEGPVIRSEAPSFLAQVEQLMKQRMADAEKNLETARQELNSSNRKIVEIQAPTTPREEPKGFKRFLRFFRRPKSQYDSLAVNSQDLRQSFARILSVNFVTGLVSTTAGLFFGSIFGPLVAVASITYFVVITILELIRELWIAQRAWDRLMEEYERAMRHRLNAILRISVHQGEVQRFSRRLSEFAIWQEVLRTVTLQPWAAMTSNKRDSGALEIDRPQSFLIGDAVLGTRGERLIQETFKRNLFTAGWLTRRFGELRDKFLSDVRPTDSGTLSQLTPENDPGQDVNENLRNQLLGWLQQYVKGTASQSDLWEFADIIVSKLDFKSEGSLVEQVVPRQPQGVDGSGQKIVLPHAIPAQLSVEGFFSPIREPGAFPDILFDSKKLQQNPKLKEALGGEPLTSESASAPTLMASNNGAWMLCNVLQFSNKIEVSELAHTIPQTGAELGGDVGTESTVGLDRVRTKPVAEGPSGDDSDDVTEDSALAFTPTDHDEMAESVIDNAIETNDESESAAESPSETASGSEESLAPGETSPPVQASGSSLSVDEDAEEGFDAI